MDTRLFSGKLRKITEMEARKIYRDFHIFLARKNQGTPKTIAIFRKSWKSQKPRKCKKKKKKKVKF